MTALRFAATGLALWASVSQAGNVTVSHYEPLERLRIEDRASAGAQKSQGTASAALTFDAFGKAFDLELLPNDRLLSPNAREALAGDVALYRGELAGAPGSWVRIVVADGMPHGLVWDGAEMYSIEAPGDTALPTSAPVIYRLADTWIPPGALSCAAPAQQASAAGAYGKLVGELARTLEKAPGATLQIDIGAIADFEFFLDKGAGAEVAMLTRLNNVDGIYSEQLDVQINVDELQIYHHPFDPFSDDRDAGNLLDELSNYRSATPAQRRQGLTHLLTGRNLAGATVGIAYTGALCEPFFGTGLSQGSQSATFDSLIAAHEIGHNFGAPHDGEGGSACASAPPTFLMAADLNGSDEFSQCSIAKIQPHLARAACIYELPSVDMTVAFDRKLQPLLLGNTATVRFVATNIGTEHATNVELNVELPDTVTPAPDQPLSCSSEGQVVRCQLGTVASGAALTQALKLVATRTGTTDLTATVTADADYNGSNNKTTQALTVVPAVDLVVNGIAAVQAGLNQTTLLEVVLENRSDLRATGVSVSAALGSGLRAESASWALGPCTVTAQQVACQADRLDARFSVALALEVTGIAAGQSSYVVALDAAEDDANPADNSVTGVVTIAAPAAGNGPTGSGGSGATGVVSLLILSCAALGIRPRCRRSAALY